MKRRLIWVSTINPFETLDVATWLVTTKELRRSGWDVTLIGFGPEGTHQVDATEIVCFPWPETYFLGQTLYHLRILRFLARQLNRADLILFHQISALWMIPLIILSKLMRGSQTRFVMDTRDLMDLTAGNMKARLRMAFYGFVYWLAPLLFDGQTTITPQMAKLVKIPPSQLWGIWPSGVEPERYKASIEKRVWPLADEPIQLMYVGILLAKRNPLPLCKAVELANQEGMAFHLTFIGNGPERPHLQTFADSPQSHITLLDPVAHAEIPAMLANAHIGVTSLPDPGDTKYEASSPIKLFEYLAAGLPILATNNICHTHVVGNGPYAFWVDDVQVESILEALRQIWAKRNDLVALGRLAEVDAGKWSWQAASQKLNDALCRGLDPGVSQGHLTSDEELRLL